MTRQDTMTELRLRDEITWRLAGDEVVAVVGGACNYISTNAAGALLWKALAGGASRDLLVDRLVEEYGIESSRAEVDVDIFLRDLEASGLLSG
jgi:Coenzyme PQQ synthesis protein D (PqqD)